MPLSKKQKRTCVQGVPGSADHQEREGMHSVRERCVLGVDRGLMWMVGGREGGGGGREGPTATAAGAIIGKAVEV